MKKILKSAAFLSIVALLGVIVWQFSRETVAEARSFQAQPPAKTVWDNVYTEAQALRGEENFTMHCLECHNGKEDGPILAGEEFAGRWREDSVNDLFRYMRTKMPENDPGSLSEAMYLDTLAYVLWLNEFPSGPTDLKVADLKGIQFVGKDGPKPLPNGTLVYSKGCLSQVSDRQWTLTNADAPKRTRNLEETPEGFKVLETDPLGNTEVRLDVAMVRATFDLAQNRDHKVFTKGLFSYDAGKFGIDVMAMQSLASSCKP